MNRLIRFVERDPRADVLVVTNMWPETGRPVYGVNVKRQVDSLVAAGQHLDVLYVRGYVSVLAYPVAAAFFLWTSAGWRHRYRLVHVHSGEAALAARFHLGTPIVVSYCGDDLLGDRRDNGTISPANVLRAKLLRAHSRLFPRTITQSAGMHAVLPQAVQARNRVIPTGVDTAIFHPIPREQARAALGWPPDERVAVFAATKPYSPAKRLSLARKACELAAQAKRVCRAAPCSALDTVDAIPGLKHIRNQPLLIAVQLCFVLCAELFSIKFQGNRPVGSQSFAHNTKNN